MKKIISSIVISVSLLTPQITLAAERNVSDIYNEIYSLIEELNGELSKTIQPAKISSLVSNSNTITNIQLVDRVLTTNTGTATKRSGNDTAKFSIQFRTTAAGGNVYLLNEAKVKSGSLSESNHGFYFNILKDGQTATENEDYRIVSKVAGSGAPMDGNYFKVANTVTRAFGVAVEIEALKDGRYSMELVNAVAKDQNGNGKVFGFGAMKTNAVNLQSDLDNPVVNTTNSNTSNNTNTTTTTTTAGVNLNSASVSSDISLDFNDKKVISENHGQVPFNRGPEGIYVGNKQPIVYKYSNGGQFIFETMNVVQINRWATIPVQTFTVKNNGNTATKLNNLEISLNGYQKYDSGPATNYVSGDDFFKPWEYFDKIHLKEGSKWVAAEDVSSQSAWEYLGNNTWNYKLDSFNKNLSNVGKNQSRVYGVYLKPKAKVSTHDAFQFSHIKVKTENINFATGGSVASPVIVDMQNNEKEFILFSRGDANVPSFPIEDSVNFSPKITLSVDTEKLDTSFDLYKSKIVLGRNHGINDNYLVRPDYFKLSLNSTNLNYIESFSLYKDGSLVGTIPYVGTVKDYYFRHSIYNFETKKLREDNPEYVWKVNIKEGVELPWIMFYKTGLSYNLVNSNGEKIGELLSNSETLRETLFDSGISYFDLKLAANRSDYQVIYYEEKKLPEGQVNAFGKNSWLERKYAYTNEIDKQKTSSQDLLALTIKNQNKSTLDYDFSYKVSALPFTFNVTPYDREAVSHPEKYIKEIELYEDNKKINTIDLSDDSNLLLRSQKGNTPLAAVYDLLGNAETKEIKKNKTVTYSVKLKMKDNVVGEITDQFNAAFWQSGFAVKAYKDGELLGEYSGTNKKLNLNIGANGVHVKFD